MRFRFLVKDYLGSSQHVEEEFISINRAKEWAKGKLINGYLVKSVTIYRLLTNDSCGPIRYIGEFRYGDL